MGRFLMDKTNVFLIEIETALTLINSLNWDLKSLSNVSKRDKW